MALLIEIEEPMLNTENTIGITNAPWWLNHSSVVLKGLCLAEDDAWITNNIVSVQNAGTNNVSVETRTGDQALLKIQRMVKSGTVAVMLRGGQKYEVSLPSEVGKLLPVDAAYIVAQIDAMSQPMSAEEQANFLKSVNEQSEAN